MKRSILARGFPALLLAAFLLPAAVSAQTQSAPPPLSIDRGELEATKDEKIVFVNYEGPQSRIDSLAAIKGIGSSLGRAMPNIAAGAARAGGGRYAVIRAVDPAVTEGFEADIIVVGADAEVDHVRNLRWIIAGYLSAAWDYAEKDAYLLATFITVYNAVHRGELAYFGSRYKAVVMKELSADNAGLSRRYDEWPGKSRIVIPLSRGARPGSLGAVDTGLVADRQVVESLRGEPGKGVEERQALVELKEREAEEKKAEAAKAEGVAAADRRTAAEEAAKAAAAADAAALSAAKAAEDKAAAETARAEADRAAGAGQSAELVAQKEAEAAAAEQRATASAEEAEAAQAAAAAAADKAAAAEKTAAESTQAAEAAKEVAAAKEAEAASERKEVAADQKALIAEEVATKQKGEAAGIYLFESDTLQPLSRIVFVDTDTGKRIRASTLNTIRHRALIDSVDRYVAVAGKEGGSGAVRLVALDKASLTQVAEGKTDLFADSALWKFGDAYYAVAKAEGGVFRLVRFDAALAETASSAVAVNPYTSLVEGAGGLVVQSAKGGFLVLSKDKLERIKDLAQ